MKRKTIVVLVLLLLLGIAIAESNTLVYYYTNLDWYATQSAEEAPLPNGLTEREAEIYRAGYANGHYDALNPAYVEGVYVLNTKTKKFHFTDCKTTLLIESDNRRFSTDTPEELMDQNYKPCGQCHPEGETNQ